MKTQKLTDDNLMPFGKYKGDKMINVPAYYLMWLYDNNKCNNLVRDYIEDNWEVLEKEINRR